jgi:hypothetical protein
VCVYVCVVHVCVCCACVGLDKILFSIFYTK